MDWHKADNIKTHSFRCGYCDRDVASNRGYTADGPAALPICPRCWLPTLFTTDSQVPAPMFGAKVESLPDNVAAVYNEARRCMSVGSCTGAVLLCRKLLMHIAVEKGAKAGETFKSYVSHLADQHWVPPGSEDWVDSIRQTGNDANHEIAIMDRQAAERLISFCELLLKFIYEFPNRVK